MKLGTQIIALRFVDKENKIREEFLDLIAVKRITGEALSVAIIDWLATKNIDITCCRGQGYDGAANNVF